MMLLIAHIEELS